MKVYHILIFSFIFLLFNTANAQETWFFELNDGKVIEGELTKRGFHSGEKKIDFRNKKTKKKEHIELVGPFSQDANSFNSKKAFSKIMSTTLKVALADSCPSFTEGLDKHSYLMHEYEKVVDDYTAKCK